MIDTKTMTDEQCLQTMSALLADRVTLGTGYLQDDSGLLTHSVLVLTAGEYRASSKPVLLTQPLMPVNQEPRVLN